MNVLMTISNLVSSSDDEDSDETDNGSNALISDIDLDQLSDNSDEWSSDEEIDTV